ncbi:MAG: UDP-N-acetylglucosamine 2-epimerase (non-hydrolyzing) [Nitrospirales bacterium]
MNHSPVKVMCIVGARPNFMKAAPVIDALERRNWATVTLVHTGQHYSREMSDLFFDALGLPTPQVDLHVGSGPHGEQTGHIMIRLEPLLKQQRPDLVIVFGDVNSTVGAALCAAKMGIPVAHVEAGLRSFDRTMPEELNRVVTDHLSEFLFTTERSGRENLSREGLPEEKIYFVGNVMVDTLLKHVEQARHLQTRRTFGLSPQGYGLLTLHRPSNVDDVPTFKEIMTAINELATGLPILFPCHVRTRERLTAMPELLPARGGRHGIVLLEPLGYLEFLSLMCEARLVLTDSGGIQEETTVLGIPCVTLRHNTERPVTIEQGTNMLAGTSQERIVEAAHAVLRRQSPPRRPPDLWDGHAADRIVDVLERRFHATSSMPERTDTVTTAYSTAWAAHAKFQ